MEKIVLEKQDMTYLSWSKIRNSSGTAGSLLKSTEERFGRKIYYKLSDYDSIRGIVGHECVNEIIVDRLLDILGIKHLSYRLIHADILINGKRIETYLCASDNFKLPGEQKRAFDNYYDDNKENNESPLEFCVRQGWENKIYEMFLVDYLVLNRDRHGANLEVLYNSKTGETRLAPLFDHGLSFLCRCLTTEEIESFDVKKDRRVQSFLGSGSAYENLLLIPKDKMPNVNSLKETDRELLFAGLKEIVPECLLNKIWEMLWVRWCQFEDLRNKERI